MERVQGAAPHFPLLLALVPTEEVRDEGQVDKALGPTLAQALGGLVGAKPGGVFPHKVMPLAQVSSQAWKGLGRAFPDLLGGEGDLGIVVAAEPFPELWGLVAREILCALPLVALRGADGSTSSTLCACE